MEKLCGMFSLEELRRKRDAGELTESELVWRPGMQLSDQVAREAAKKIVRLCDRQLLDSLADLDLNVYRGNRGHLMEEEVTRFLEEIARLKVPTDEVLEWKATLQSPEEKQEAALELFRNLLPGDDGL